MKLFSLVDKSLLLAFGLGVLTFTAANAGDAVRVDVVKSATGWQLTRAGQPYFIKGAGGGAPLTALKAAGGNSVRTWGADQVQSVLDDAQKNGLTVCVGIWLHHENDAEGFSYSKPEMVQKQLEQVRQYVNRFKDHPALLMWGLGNEMEGETGEKVEIWEAIQAAAKLTKQLDPNHPTMTVIAEIGGAKVPSIHKYCPDIDIIGINSYGGGPSVAERYAKLNGTKPYVLTEFGTLGPWEIEKTSWGATYEPTSTEKADWYRKTYTNSILNQPLCLGSYAFLWGQKQEATATWFGMFLKDGTKVQAVDTMSELWTGKPVANPCPIIKRLALRGKNEFVPGATIQADLEAVDPGGQPLKVRWVVQPEQMEKLSAGAEEKKLPELTSIVLKSDATHAEVTAPEESGGYRLFAYVYNEHGAAVANVTFYVANSQKPAAGQNAKLPVTIYADQGGPNNHYIPSGWMGNTKAIKMDEGCRINPHNGPTCMRFEYQATDGWAGVVWQDPADDWGDRPGGLNLAGAKNLTFWARGEKGGELVSFKFGLLGKEKPHHDTDSASLDEIKLTPEWKQYSIDVAGKNLASIKTGFCWTVKGQNTPLMFYLDEMRFE